MVFPSELKYINRGIISQLQNQSLNYGENVSTNMAHNDVLASFVSTLFVSIIIVIYSLSPLNAQANDALTMSLAFNKVVTNNDGNISYIPVTSAEKGNVIQYKATYTNTLNKPINDVMVTLPIPTNMRLTGEVYPLSAQGSTNYHNYADLPLMRRVNGKLVKVPFTEYKSLRWNIKYLPSKKSATVTFNAVVE